ncbi:hypothetical protein PSTT_00757 [Puccinia striiformis]|uniref:DDE Tnp4 domain-containing protein n=2 Tax=Puccinia striiformis TaxID=27350 RepID=A0A2S4W6F9_9BASI|nr:hypothetical protein PSTT_00757 [Puccinia striiformis]
MVRSSERRQLLKSLEKSIRQDLIDKATDPDLEEGSDDSSSGADSDDDQDREDEEEGMLAILEDKVQALLSVESKRYLRPRGRILKGPEDNHYYLEVLEEKRFKVHFRMSRESFFNLCNLVADNPIFHNNSTCPQRPVVEQMMVTLNRLGCHGNGVSVAMLACKYRMGEGSVELYTNRCIMAILGLKPQLLAWPNAEERSEVSSGFADVGFEGCVGLIDGTLVVLSTCPGRDGPDYYNRKGSYGITTLLVCDQEKNITHVYTGWPGCSHDQRLMNNCGLSQAPTDFFSDDQYLLADSAFTATTTVVPAFKRARNRGLTEEQHDFNRHLSGVRVGIENCIGLLKNRFQSLKGLRLRASTDQDLVRINAWIMACCVLHNFLNRGGDIGFGYEDSTPLDDSSEDIDPQEQPGKAAGKRKRKEVLQAALAFREDGGSY